MIIPIRETIQIEKVIKQAEIVEISDVNALQLIVTFREVPNVTKEGENTIDLHYKLKGEPKTERIVNDIDSLAASNIEIQYAMNTLGALIEQHFYNKKL